LELPRGQRSGKESWTAHIKAAEAFDGTNKEYCKVHGLNYGSFNGYKNKLGYSRRAKAKPSEFSEIRVSSSEVFGSGTQLPDPKWLADFLRAWMVSHEVR
jgi:hypothetical protein